MAKMDRRQKGIMLLTIVALVFLGWQVYSLISDDLAAKPAVANPLNSSSASSSAYKAKPAPAPMAPVRVAEANPNAIAPKAQNNLPAELVESLTFPARPEYLRLANQYEMAKMQRQLLEEQVAIANAQAQIAKLSGPSLNTANVTTENGTAVASGLELVYVAEQKGRWTATINQNGTYQVVEVGMQLPPDIQIVAIDKEGVLIEQESTRKKLTFNGMITLSKPMVSEHQQVKEAEQKVAHVT